MIQTYTVLFPKFRRRTKFQILNAVLIVLSLILFSYTKSAIFILLIVPNALWFDYLHYSKEDPFNYFDKTLIFDNSKIIIDEDVFNIEELEKLEIGINNYDGKVMEGRGKQILNGTGNQLSFDFKGRVFKFLFYIESESRLKEYSNLFDGWYKMKYSFRENRNGYKTYLLKSLNYKEIQDFKKTYAISQNEFIN